MKVTYEDHYGSDLKVVNMARVSFAKRKAEFDEKDAKLIRYLAEHNHWTPFGHCGATLHISAPIAIARQIFKHKIGFVENEMSRRYVDDEPSVFIPQTFRNYPDNKKQGSGDDFSWVDNADATEIYHEAMHLALNFYSELLERGVAPEQARFVLPQATMTEWYLTGTLPAWARMYKLRYAPDAQKETQEVAKQIGDIMEQHFPISWKALTP